MGKYWLKIGLGAAAIFLVGSVIVRAASSVRERVHSDESVTIPLGAFGAYLPMKLDGVKIGTLRSLTIQRSSPREIAGFVIRARATDAAALEQLRECHVSVTDATNIDERTTFFCLKSDSGYQAFGELRVELRNDNGSNTVIQQTLMLTEGAVREFRNRSADPAAAPVADSLAAQVQSQVRIQARAISDSIRAAGLEERGRDMLKRADSIRAGSPAKPPPAVPKP